MNDPRLEGTSIFKGTLCKVGVHSFIYTSTLTDGTNNKRPPPLGLRCSCGAYTWEDWMLRVK